MREERPFKTCEKRKLSILSFYNSNRTGCTASCFYYCVCVFVCEMVEGRKERDREVESRREGGNLLLPYYNFLSRKGFWIKIFNHAPFL